MISFAVEIIYLVLSKPLVAAFNNNPQIIMYGRKLLFSQMILFPSFGLCYMMTITYQTIGESGYGLFLSTIRQGIFYVPLILILPRIFSFMGICLSQPIADILTVIVCVLSVNKMKRVASINMKKE